MIIGIRITTAPAPAKHQMGGSIYWDYAPLMISANLLHSQADLHGVLDCTSIRAPHHRDDIVCRPGVRLHIVTATPSASRYQYNQQQDEPMQSPNRMPLVPQPSGPHHSKDRQGE